MSDRDSDRELQRVVEDQTLAFDVAARLSSDPRIDRDDLSPSKRPVWMDEGYDA